jgi:hypothetical protein
MLEKNSIVALSVVMDEDFIPLLKKTPMDIQSFSYAQNVEQNTMLVGIQT